MDDEVLKIAESIKEIIVDYIPQLDKDPFISYASEKKGMLYIDIMDVDETYAIYLPFSQLIDDFIDSNIQGVGGPISKEDAAEFLGVLREGIRRIESHVEKP